MAHWRFMFTIEVATAYDNIWASGENVVTRVNGRSVIADRLSTGDYNFAGAPGASATTTPTAPVPTARSANVSWASTIRSAITANWTATTGNYLGISSLQATAPSKSLTFMDTKTGIQYWAIKLLSCATEAINNLLRAAEAPVPIISDIESHNCSQWKCTRPREGGSESIQLPVGVTAILYIGIYSKLIRIVIYTSSVILRCTETVTRRSSLEPREVRRCKVLLYKSVIP